MSKLFKIFILTVVSIGSVCCVPEKNNVLVKQRKAIEEARMIMENINMNGIDMPDGMNMNDTRFKMMSPEKRNLDFSSIESDSEIVSLCESSTEFKYFIPYPNDETKYVQCDPWGTGSLKSCKKGLVWNMWSLKCENRENIRNLTFNFPTQEIKQVNCSLVGLECLNDGICQVTPSGSYKCVCRPDFSGQFCESRVDSTDLSHQILNGTFSIVDYKARLIEQNISVDASYYERYRDHLDNGTYSELMNYLTFYKKGDVRYDSLINSLIQDILEDIYPDAEYLSSFNASSQNVIAMVRLIPSLLSYSRYSLDRYEEVFGQYQKILQGLVNILNSTVPTIRDEALQYSRLTEMFLNQTMMILRQKSAERKNLVIDNQFVESVQLSQVEMKDNLKFNFNSTLNSIEELFNSLEEFQNTLLQEMQTNPSLSSLTLGEAKFSGAQNILALFNKISASSSQIWDSLVNYGFWYMTNALSVRERL